MTDKEKAEEYVNALLNKDDTELDKFLDANLGDLKLNNKQAGTLLGLIKGIGICSYLDGLAEGRKEVREHETTCVNRLHHVEKENAELKAHCKAVDDVNEKMKCCGNCDNNAYCNKEHYGNDKGCEDWKLAE